MKSLRFLVPGLAALIAAWAGAELPNASNDSPEPFARAPGQTTLVPFSWA